MRLFAIAGAAALALLTFFQFPGHTYLQQDTQVYVPILERLRDPSVLRNDILARQPQVAFTLYDEAALVLRHLTSLGFREVLGFQQVVTRALGIWGLILCGAALLACTERSKQAAGPVLLIASICALGAVIAGPSVLIAEYEPTPRAFAVPLLICAAGLVAHQRYVAAGIAAAAAFLYHPPTAVPFWFLYLVLAFRPARLAPARSRMWGIVPLVAAVAILVVAAHAQAGPGEAWAFFSRVTPFEEKLQRMRTSYVWISAWPRSIVLHHLVLFGIVVAAWARIRREMPFELRVFLLGLPILGILSMPVSWLLLERWRWALLPQFQPLRALLFVALSMQLLAAAAGVRAALGRRLFEAFGWFALAYLLPLQPVVTQPYTWKRTAVVLALAGLAAIAVRLAPSLAPAAGVAAFFAIPILGGVVNYPRLHTPELAQLSEWARSSTPKDAVFLFPDGGRSLSPGIFRSEGLRAVYVDWKGGGQINYGRDFAGQWWFRWQLTVAKGFQPPDLPRYAGLGIDYVVLSPGRRLPQPPAFENRQFLAYRIR